MRAGAAKSNSRGYGVTVKEDGLDKPVAGYRPTRQVAPEVYDSRYLHAGRLANYFEQLLQVQRQKPNRVLEVGIGGGLMKIIAARVTPASWTTCDIDAALHPDVVGSVTDLPFADKVFDLTLCCQVLEHLPFDLFPRCLAELGRVTAGNILISLPDTRRYYAFACCLPKIGWIEKEINIERMGPRHLPFKGEHYWEIGYTGSRWRDVRECARATGVEIVKAQRIRAFPYFNFLLMRSG